MGYEREAHQPQTVVETTEFLSLPPLLPEPQFVVKPILEKHFESLKEASPDLLSALQYEELLLKSSTPEAQQQFRLQMSYSLEAHLIVTHHDPDAVELYKKLDEAYNLAPTMKEIPKFWRKYIIDHGMDHPLPPHLQPKPDPEQE